MPTSQVAVEQVAHTTEDLLSALEVLRQKMIADYQTTGFNMFYDISFEFGSKYVRVVHNRDNSRSCAGFVVCDTKNKKFAFGDMLMSAGWKAPATNKARGNVFNLEGKYIAWTGIQ